MLNAIKEIIYTMNPKARPKSESTTKNVADDGSKVINNINYILYGSVTHQNRF